MPEAFGPHAYDPTLPELDDHAVRAVDLVGVRRDDLAERERQHVGRGRELGHGHLRPRVHAQPRDRRQLQQPVRQPAAALRDRALGHDEPRLVQRRRRHAHAVPDPAVERARSLGSDAQPAQQAQARLPDATAKVAAPQPQRAAPRPGWSWPRSRRARSTRGRAGSSGVTIVLDGTAPVDKDPACATRRPTRIVRDADLHRLLDGGRAADRQRLVRPGPRRADLEDEDERELVVRHVHAASSGSSTRTRRTSTSSTSHGQGVTQPVTDRRPAAARRRDVQRGHELRLPVRVRGHAEPAALLRPRQVDRRATACCSYTVGVQSLDGAGPQTRGVAGRRRAGQRTTWSLVHDLHLPAHEHGHRGRDEHDGASAGRRLAVGEQRHLPALGRRRRERLARAALERARHGDVRRARSACRST